MSSPCLLLLGRRKGLEGYGPQPPRLLGLRKRPQGPGPGALRSNRHNTLCYGSFSKQSPRVANSILSQCPTITWKKSLSLVGSEGVAEGFNPWHHKGQAMAPQRTGEKPTEAGVGNEGGKLSWSQRGRAVRGTHYGHPLDRCNNQGPQENWQRELGDSKGKGAEKSIGYHHFLKETLKTREEPWWVSGDQIPFHPYHKCVWLGTSHSPSLALGLPLRH